MFVGSGGRLSIFRGHLRFSPSKENAQVGEIAQGGSPESGHMANWLEAVRGRKEPNATVEDGH